MLSEETLKFEVDLEGACACVLKSFEEFSQGVVDLEVVGILKFVLNC
jgi:hypothetical protein